MIANDGSLPRSVDIVVVGGGNAAFCAALAARESGASVLMLERAPEAEAGGNSRFTAGARSTFKPAHPGKGEPAAAHHHHCMKSCIQFPRSSISAKGPHDCE